MGTSNPALGPTYTQVFNGPCFMQNRGTCPIEVVFDTAQPAETVQGVLMYEKDQRFLQNNFPGYAVYARVARGFQNGSALLVLVS